MKTASEIQQDARAFEESTGGTDGVPDGTYKCELVSGPTHPVVKRTKAGKPYFFLLAKVTEGEYEDQHIMLNLQWFVSDTDQNGNPKEEDAFIRGQNFVRRETKKVWAALWRPLGARDGYEEAPPSVLFPDGADSEDDVIICMETWIDAMVGMPIQITRSTNGDYVNFNYAKLESGAFSYQD